TMAGEDVREQAEDQLASRLEDLIAKLSPDEISALEEGLLVMEKVLTALEPRRGKGNAVRNGYGS
ncbi:MAG: hypothetical protein M3Y37_01345, partial [Chloroflexota bacterium]|nr:hypothetical protein [Chloroflexota bacterium]